MSYDGMRITIDVQSGYDGPYYRWKVVTNGNAGFYQSGRCDSLRCATRCAKKAMKRLAGINFLPYQKPDGSVEKIT